MSERHKKKEVTQIVLIVATVSPTPPPPHSPVWTLRWALRWDDLPYIFPQPVKGQQCLFSGDSCLADAALLFRDTLGAAGPPLLSPAFNRQPPRSTFSCAPASLPPRHRLPPAAMAFGLHLFKSNKIIATISKVLLSWLSFSVSSVRPGGRLGTCSAETSASDITTAKSGWRKGSVCGRACEYSTIIPQIGYNDQKAVLPGNMWLTIHTCRLQCDYSAKAAPSHGGCRVDK